MTVHAKELYRFPVEEKDAIGDLDSLEPDAVGNKMGTGGEGNDQMVEVWGFGGPFVRVGDGDRESGGRSGSWGGRGGKATGEGGGGGGGGGSDRLGGVYDDCSRVGVEETQAQGFPKDAGARSSYGGGEGAVGVSGVEERGGVEISDVGEKGEGQEIDRAKDAREPPPVLALDVAVGEGGMSVFGEGGSTRRCF